MKNEELNLIAEEQDSPLDRMSSTSVGDIPPPDPEKMLELLQSDVAADRMLAARAFCELEDRRSIAILINLLNDVCPLIRVSTTYALGGRNSDATAVEPLIELLAKDFNGYVRIGNSLGFG